MLSLRLHSKEAINEDNEGVKMTTLLESGLPVFPFLSLLHGWGSFLRIFVLVREGISIHDTHVVNTVRPLLPEVTDQYSPFILRLILVG